MDELNRKIEENLKLQEEMKKQLAEMEEIKKNLLNSELQGLMDKRKELLSEKDKSKATLSNLKNEKRILEEKILKEDEHYNSILKELDSLDDKIAGVSDIGYVSNKEEAVSEKKSTPEPMIEPVVEDIPEEVRNEFEKAISLRVIDNYWMEHISTMSHLRDGIGLRGYANTSPLQAYTMEGYQLFDEMIARINKDISIYLLKSEIRQNLERKQVAKNAITNDSKDHAKVQKKSTKVGRNDPCPCGSGRKYKVCCGK